MMFRQLRESGIVSVPMAFTAVQLNTRFIYCVRNQLRLILFLDEKINVRTLGFWWLAEPQTEHRMF